MNRILPLIILTTLLVCSVCQNDDLYRTCSEPFKCGVMEDVGYPFYGGSRPLSCGCPGFHLDCQADDDVPRIGISSITYRVLDINLSTSTLRVSRNDLWSNLCSTSISDTALNFTIFDLYEPANDQNITLYSGCPITLPQLPLLLAANLTFNCSETTPNLMNFFVTSEQARASQQLNLGNSCNRRINVRVNQTAARELAIPALASQARLQVSLESGFTIQWSADNRKCDDCRQSGGLCGYSQDVVSFVCLCSNGTFESTCNGVLDDTDNQNCKNCVDSGGRCGYNQDSASFVCHGGRDKVGQGGFGIVYRGELPDGQIVAVKVLTKTHDNAEDFINEVASISRTSHVNIVNLLGFCYDRKRRALVYEFMPNKSLDKFIHKSDTINQECYLGWEKLFQIAVGVARGLEYLHRGCNTRIVHFDIKPQNILLDEDFSPKISDFGLAKLFKKKQSMISTIGARGTIGYIAPEVISRSFGAVSHKSDVYSYGMTLLEMAEGREIVETEAVQSRENYFPDKIYEYVLLKNKKLGDQMTEEKEETKRKLLLVGLWCIQTAPADRPSMTKVVEMLEGSIQSIQIPPKPHLASSRLSVQQYSSSVSEFKFQNGNPKKH